MNEMHAFGGGNGNDPSMMGHLNKSDVELYVINALAQSRAAEVESHVACCEACADALAREAQLEMALEILAERTSFDVEIVHAQVTPVLDALPMPLRFTVTPVTPVILAAHTIAPNAALRASTKVVPFVPASATQRRARTGLALAGALAAAAALVLWIMPSAKSDPSDDVATYGAVSADAAGAMVSFDHDVKPSLDKLDGG